MRVYEILLIFSFLTTKSIAVRGFAAQREYDRTVRRNGQIVPNIITDSQETSDLHDYLYKTLFLHDRFSIGQSKNFEFVPEITFRMNDYIYQAQRESSFFLFNNIVEKYVNLTIAIGRCDETMMAETVHNFTVHFSYFLEGSYLCSANLPENSTSCEPYQYYLQDIKGSLLTLPKSAETA